MSKICLYCNKEKKTNNGNYHTVCGNLIYKTNVLSKKYGWNLEQAINWISNKV